MYLLGCNLRCRRRCLMRELCPKGHGGAGLGGYWAPEFKECEAELVSVVRLPVAHDGQGTHKRRRISCLMHPKLRSRHGASVFVVISAGVRTAATVRKPCFAATHWS